MKQTKFTVGIIQLQRMWECNCSLPFYKAQYSPIITTASCTYRYTAPKAVKTTKAAAGNDQVDDIEDKTEQRRDDQYRADCNRLASWVTMDNSRHRSDHPRPRLPTCSKRLVPSTCEAQRLCQFVISQMRR